MLPNGGTVEEEDIIEVIVIEALGLETDILARSLTSSILKGLDQQGLGPILVGLRIGPIQVLDII